jgi:hypothetical protein
LLRRLSDPEGFDCQTRGSFLNKNADRLGQAVEDLWTHRPRIGVPVSIIAQQTARTANGMAAGPSTRVPH